MHSIFFTVGCFSIFSVFIAFTPLQILAADGSGANIVSPTSVDVSETNQTFTFTYTAAEAMNSGGMAITIPDGDGWSEPQAIAGTAGRTTASVSGSALIADSISEADSTTGWTEDDDDTCNRATNFAAGWGLDTTTFYESSGAITCDNIASSAPDATDSLSYDYGSPQDFSGYTTLGFWFRVNADMNGSSMRVGLDDSTACDSINDNTTLAAVSANTWTYVTWTFAGAGATRNNIQAVCFYFAGNTGMDGKQWWVDDILIGPGSPTFVANGSDTDIRLRFLQMALSETATVIYGAGGGTSGVDVPAAPGVYEMTTKSKVDSSGTLTSISTQPTITALGAGELSVDIVDSGGTTVGSPAVSFGATTFPFAATTTTGILGSSSQKIRVSNTTGSGAWSLTMAPTSGNAAVWTSGGDDYDFNDSQSDGTDDSDADGVGGRLTVSPVGSDITPVSPCASTTGVSAGSATAFREITTAVSSITLASATSGASGSCAWDITDIDLMQIIPARQPIGNYSLSFTITIS